MNKFKMIDLYEWADKNFDEEARSDMEIEFSDLQDANIFISQLSDNWWKRFRVWLSFKFYPHKPKILMTNSWKIDEEKGS